MIVDVEVLPQPLGTAANPYEHVEAAIAVARRSGLRHEVHALGTTVEGPPDDRRMHEACLRSGAGSVVTVVKFAEAAGGDGPTIDGLTAKFRP